MLPFQSAPPVEAMGLDPIMLLEMLAQHLKPGFEPKVPAGYKKEKRPDHEIIWGAARRMESKMQRKTARQMTTIQRLRGDGSITGMFPGEFEAKDAGDLDTWVDQSVVADYNLMCSISASMEFAAVKKVLNKAHAVEAQTMEDWVLFQREEEIYRWAMGHGDMPLPMAEYRVLYAYGEIVSRHLPDLDNPEYPFTDTLIDPISFYPIFDGRKLKRAYRLFRTTYAAACEDFGEPVSSEKKKLEDTIGKGNDRDLRLITLAEYADCTWRSVVGEGGTRFLAPKEHNLYTNPFVYQGGPYGEPRFTDTGRAGTGATDRRVGSADYWLSGPDDDWGMEHKLTGAQHHQWPTKDQLEALMSHIVTSFKSSLDPALVITRDNFTAKKPLPDISRRPGSVNELGPGESLDVLPTTANPMDTQPLLQSLNAQMAKTGIPIGLYGNQAGLGSNISGNSMANAAEAGFDAIRPGIEAMETYHTQKYEKKNLIFRNVGHLSRFQEGEEKPFMVSVRQTSRTQELAQAMTPELIDKVGPRVKVNLTRLRVSDMIPLTQAAQAAIGAGLGSRRDWAEKIGRYDFDRMEEEINAEMLDQLVRQDEDLQKLVWIPEYLSKRVKDAETPEEREIFTLALRTYMQKQQAAMVGQMMPPQPGMLPGGGGGPGAGGPALPPGGQPPVEALGGGPPPPPPGSVVIPPGQGVPGQAGGRQDAMVGAGPGSATGIQGGPRGPRTVPFA
jgi:hypothetical protein